MLKLIRKSYEQPALLIPFDLDPIKDLVGEGYLDYVHIIESFHYINRIAGLLNVSPEILPRALRRFDILKESTIHLSSHYLAKGNLANREYGKSYDEAINDVEPIFKRATGKEPYDELSPLRTSPKLVEVIQMHLEERDTRSCLDRDTRARIQNTVEEALHTSAEKHEVRHKFQRNPIENFAYIGTRFAYRTTRDMIDALKREGYDDIGILDLATAVADSNKWARTYRLLNLDPNLLYV